MQSWEMTIGKGNYGGRKREKKTLRDLRIVKCSIAF